MTYQFGDIKLSIRYQFGFKDYQFGEIIYQFGEMFRNSDILIDDTCQFDNFSETTERLQIEDLIETGNS